MTLAFVFPGQGAQTPGMGRALADAYPAAAEVFRTVDDALGERLSDVIWGEDAAALTRTANAQPALLAMSMAALAALKAEGVEAAAASHVAGHSLGEYAALCAAGALALPDAARLLRLRGEAMQRAVPEGMGAMAALLGADVARAEALAAEAAEGEVIEAANDNDPTQVVLSGHRGAIERAVALAPAHGIKRAVLLPVSAPFHCSLMAPAAAEMARALEGVEIAPPAMPLVPNVRAAPVDDPCTIRALLVEQITGRVRWRESVVAMAAAGVTEMWEVGAGKALTGMIRRIDRSVAARQVGTPEEVAAAAAG